MGEIGGDRTDQFSLILTSEIFRATVKKEAFIQSQIKKYGIQNCEEIAPGPIGEWLIKNSCSGLLEWILELSFHDDESNTGSIVGASDPALTRFPQLLIRPAAPLGIFLPSFQTFDSLGLKTE